MRLFVDILTTIFHMFSLPDLCFVLCSRDLDVLSAQRMMGFFIFAYPQINGARKPGHVENVLALSLSLLIFFSFPSHSVLPIVPCILSSIVSGTLPPVDSNSTKAPLSHDSSTTNSVTTTTAVIAVAVAMLAAILILVLVYLKRKNKIPKPKMTKR